MKDVPFTGLLIFHHYYIMEGIILPLFEGGGTDGERERASGREMLRYSHANHQVYNLFCLCWICSYTFILFTASTLFTFTKWESQWITGMSDSQGMKVNGALQYINHRRRSDENNQYNNFACVCVSGDRWMCIAIICGQLYTEHLKYFQCTCTGIREREWVGEWVCDTDCPRSTIHRVNK